MSTLKYHLFLRKNKLEICLAKQPLLLKYTAKHSIQWSTSILQSEDCSVLTCVWHNKNLPRKFKVGKYDKLEIYDDFHSLHSQAFNQ